MSSQPQPRGCLAALFGGSSPQTAAPTVPQYRLREDFLSATELSFLRTAQIAVGNRFTILAKVNLADLFFSPTRDAVARNRISQKHVDFLLCDPQSLTPAMGIELDDSSHQRADRVERDVFVDTVFESAGLPLIHLPAQQSYGSADITTAIGAALRSAAIRQSAAVVVDSGGPICPNCGLPMILRKAGRGSQSGRQFYGCINFPRCRETRQLEPETK
jgi:hypothetical protein